MLDATLIVQLPLLLGFAGRPNASGINPRHYLNWCPDQNRSVKHGGGSQTGLHPLSQIEGPERKRRVYRHALRNAILPAVTVSGLLVAYLLGGAVIVEIVFSWPGVGNASLAAADVLDINFLELYVLVTAVIIVVTNLVVDVLYSIIDPRIRY